MKKRLYTGILEECINLTRAHKNEQLETQVTCCYELLIWNSCNGELKEQVSVSVTGNLFISNISYSELLHSAAVAEKLQRFAATLSE